MASVEPDHRCELSPKVPTASSLSRHFPTLSVLRNWAVSLWGWFWRRRRSVANAAAIAALALVFLYGCREYVVGPHRDAVAAITRAGGISFYDWQWSNGLPPRSPSEPPGPGWLVSALGRDWFGHVVAVDLAGQKADDALLLHIGRLTRLKQLHLDTPVTSTGFAQLESLGELEDLSLSAAGYGDDDLARLAGLTQLTTLTLRGERITDRGLSHLAKMRQLGSLRVHNTSIKSLEPIRGLTQLKLLDLTDTPIGDEGLRPIEELTSLGWLSLGGTRVTDAGIKHLLTLSKLMEVRLDRTNVGDAGVELLCNLPRLKMLYLVDTQVSNAGLADLADTLNSNPGRFLVISGPKVTPAGLAALRNTLARVQVVDPDRIIRQTMSGTVSSPVLRPGP